MAESFSDEELDEGIRPPRVEPFVAEFIGRLGMTIERLQRERDEARRVARSVARDWLTYLLNGTLRDPAPDVDTALAYPEVKS